MSIVFILCISSDGVILRLVSVLSYVMVGKVERLLRGQWSALNIYRAFSSPPSRWASCYASRFLVSLLRLVAVSRLLLSRCASYRSILSSCLVFVLVSFLSLSLVVADALAIPFVERLMSVASRRRVSRVLVYCSSCILSWASRLVPRAVLIRSVLLLLPSVSGRRGVAWMSLSSCGHGGGVSVPVFLIGSAGERHETTGMRRFIQLDFSYSYSRGRVCAHGVMISIWDEVDGA